MAYPDQSGHPLVNAPDGSSSNIHASPRRDPFPPGTQQTIAAKIVLARQVIADLQRAQSAGLNVATLLVRAQQAHDTLHQIHAAYYGPTPPSH